MRASRSRWLPTAILVIAGAAAQTAAALGTVNQPSLPQSAIQVTHLDHGRFQDFLVYSPVGIPTSFVLFLSSEAGWNAATDATARQLVQQGAMVTGIDWAKFKKNLEADAAQCVFPDGDLENLSHFVQAYLHNPTYLSPLLVGTDTGAGMAYAMLAQAPKSTFAGALTVNFCPHINLEKPLCKGSGLESTHNSHGGTDFSPIDKLANPWLDLQDHQLQSCASAVAPDFVSKIRGAAVVTLPTIGVANYIAGYNKLAAQNSLMRVAPAPASLNDLPVVEVPAQPSAVGPTSRADTFALIMSGDGGWAGLDQDVAAALSANGIPVVGLDSLRYYWTARTPDGLATDTDRIIRYYLAHFGKQHVLLIGYSQGADVLPFAVNRLPQATRAHVALAAVMGMSEHALFEFHVSSWISDDNSGPATLPEINRITRIPVLCIYGADESDSLCPKLDAQKFHVVKLKGGHHFDGDYANLAHEILTASQP